MLTKLIIDDKEHNLALILAHAKSSPVITFKESELMACDEFTGKFTGESHIRVEPSDSSVIRKDIVLYKYNGKYIVLSGADTIIDLFSAGSLELKGKLISGFVFKKTTITDEVPNNPVIRNRPVVESKQFDRQRRT